MKGLIILLLMLCCLTAWSQKIKELEKFKRETLKIMKILSIPVRQSISKDDPIKIIIVDNYLLLNCSFVRDTGSYTIKNGFRNSKIEISPLLDSVISKKIDTSYKVYIKAAGHIIHELTHYFQKTIIASNKEYLEASVYGYKISISQPIEFEAHAVNAYYYLRLINNKTLQEIMRKPLTQKRKFELLINAYWKEVYPWRTPVF